MKHPMKNRPLSGLHRAHAFTLIEVVIAVLVLSIAVPPTLNLMDTASSGRVDSINTTRATFLSTIVLETVLADMTSDDPSLGFAALSDSAIYLSAPTTGLYNRLSTIIQPYTTVGLSYTVVIGPLVSFEGTVSINPSDNIFRTVTVNVTYSSASTGVLVMPTSILVSSL